MFRTIPLNCLSSMSKNWSHLLQSYFQISILWDVAKDRRREKKKKEGKGLAEGSEDTKFYSMLYSTFFFSVWVRKVLLFMDRKGACVEEFPNLAGAITWKWKLNLYFSTLVALWDIVCCDTNIYFILPYHLFFFSIFLSKFKCFSPPHFHPISWNFFNWTLVY